MKHEENDSSVDEEDEQEEPVITARSIFSDNLVLVQSVIKCYLELNERPEISAMNLDPASHQSRWTYVGAEFQADTASQLRKFLVTRPDRIELRQAWNELLKDSPKIGDKERRLVNGLGPIFRRAGLLPAAYFKPTMKRRAQ